MIDIDRVEALAVKVKTQKVIARSLAASWHSPCLGDVPLTPNVARSLAASWHSPSGGCSPYSQCVLYVCPTSLISARVSPRSPHCVLTLLFCTDDLCTSCIPVCRLPSLSTETVILACIVWVGVLATSWYIPSECGIPWVHEPMIYVIFAWDA